MSQQYNQQELLKGIVLAVLATIIWSGNFVVARGVIHEIPPVSLAFFRWTTGTLILAPFALKHSIEQKELNKEHWKYLLIVSIFGITIYNTLIYVAGRYLPAVNLALIGTTSSPIMSIILAGIFLKEKLTKLRVVGIVICIIGILYLLSRGSWERLMGFHFSLGDAWILAAAFTFAVYNVMVRKKPATIHPLNFLFITFLIGTLLLAPAFVIEHQYAAPIKWSWSLAGVILYLGAGNSVLSFLFWNASISKLGAGRTALFGNLIPIFSSIEAVLFLGESIQAVHWISGILVIGGLIIANIRKP